MMSEQGSSKNDKTSDLKRRISFWLWFVRGYRHKPGYRGLINKWLFLHLAVGAFISTFAPVCLQQAAGAVLFPLGGILVGLTFAWAGNANAMLQVEEMQELAQRHPGGFNEYVFIYQSGILVILVTLILWALAGFGLYNGLVTIPIIYTLLKISIYFMSSLTIQVCWRLILYVQQSLLAVQVIRDIKKANGPPDKT